LQVDEAPDQVQQVVALPDGLPEVAGAVLAVDDRVPSTAVAATIEGQEAGRGAGQPGGHPDLVRVDGEVHQRPRLEAEDRRPRVAVMPILMPGVTDLLARQGILQLRRGDGQPVQEQDQVQLIVGLRVVAELTDDAQAVLVVQLPNRRVQVMAGPNVGEPDPLAVELEAPAQHREHAEAVQGLGQGVDEEPVQGRAVDGMELGPGLGLGGLDEGQHLGADQGAVDVVVDLGCEGVGRIDRARSARLKAAVKQ
jgi:hypothetical protein